MSLPRPNNPAASGHRAITPLFRTGRTWRAVPDQNSHPAYQFRWLAAADNAGPACGRHSWQGQ